MPRPIAANVYPNRYIWNKNIVVTKEEIDDGRGNVTIIQRCDPNKFLTIKRVAETLTFAAQNTLVSFKPSEQYLTPGTFVGADLELHDSNGHLIKPTFDSSGAGLVAIQAGLDFYYSNGALIYDLEVASNAMTAWTFQAVNGTPYPTQLTTRFTGYSGSHGSRIVVGNADVVATVQNQGVVCTASYTGGTLTTLNTLLTDPNVTGFSFSFSTTGSGDNFCPAEWSTMSMQTNGNLVCDGGISYENFSLWQLVDSSNTAKRLFDESDSYSITGMKTLFQNVTPELYRGGSAFAAQFPGNSERKLPNDPSKMNSIISSLKVNRFKETNLDKGLHYIWTPEKLQDLFFIQPGAPVEKPFAVVGVVPTASSEADFQLNLRGVVSVELITYDPAVPQFKAVSNSVLYDALCAGLSDVENWSHNPDHIQHIGRMIKKVMTNDQVKMAMKALLMTGVKLAPMVISAIA